MPTRLAKKTAAVLAVLLGAGLAGNTAAAERLVFMTGPAGGTWYPLGGAMKQIFEEEIDGLTITLRPGAGLINIKAIEQEKAEIALGHVISTVDAINGRPPFSEPIADLCNLGALYQQAGHVVTIDSAIDSIADFEGRSVGSLPRGNTNEFAFRMLLAMHDLTYDDLGNVNFASITDMVNMMKDGHIEAISLITAFPSGSIMDLTSVRNVKFLDITEDELARLKARNAGWSRVIIPAGMYGQDRDVETVGFPMHVLVSCSRVSDDLAYDLTKALATRVRDLAAINASLAEHDIEDLTADIGVPFHPGAERYYREIGAIPETVSGG